MTVDEFLVWAEGQPGRYELVDGEVFGMSPERVRHAEVKASAYLALRSALGRTTLPCRALPDGMSVRIDHTTVFEPDALVYCGPRANPDAIEITDPIIVVEVLSPSTAAVDSGRKFAGYFALMSMRHYLIIDPMKRLVIHHRRGADGLIVSRIATDSTLDLTPPGLTLPVAELFADLPPPADPAA
ncbi:Uma2 family endonuclease [Methylobacterium sp. E-005]|uniref:Uma2 family endonuclease n=1 Tax=Methylobacterium sp. E-005 TaxID=2836549 RepID=UPI001FBBAA76|nr:Uma2 family endonuclease [Methylobacterium sp. E-005]MCJ2087851.1 Uma2 family endonuclease [Methylobacterium sp. E-005]